MHPTDGRYFAVDSRILKAKGKFTSSSTLGDLDFGKSPFDDPIYGQGVARKYIWRKHKLQLDLRTDYAPILYHLRRVEVQVTTQKRERGFGHEKIQTVIEDNVVDNSIASMDLSEFSPSKEMQGKLRNLLWDGLYIFKGLGKIAGTKHRM